MPQAYNKIRPPPMETAHITKRCFLFAKICKTRRMERCISPENPAAIATNHVKYLTITV
jgi:hypothetical protein